MRWGRPRHGASARRTHQAGSWKSIWGPRLRWLGVLAALAGSGYGLYTATQKLLEPERFPLRHIYLEGELRNLTAADLQQRVQGWLGQNFFALNIVALYATVAADPWIEHLTIRRRWPDTLEIHFQERTPFGRWGEDEMVDSNGQRFRPAVVRQPGPWPYLEGPDGHERVLIRSYAKAAELLGTVGLRPVRLVQDERRAWLITLANGTQLYLGREDFEQRLKRFIAVYPRVLAERLDQVAAVDLRYTQGFAVRWNAVPDPKASPARPSVTAGRAANSAG